MQPIPFSGSCILIVTLILLSHPPPTLESVCVCVCVCVLSTERQKHNVNTLEERKRSLSLPDLGVLPGMQVQSTASITEWSPTAFYRNNVNRRKASKRIQINLLFKIFLSKGTQFFVMHIQSKYVIFGWRSQLLKASGTNALLDLSQRIKSYEHNGGVHSAPSHTELL